MTTTLPLYICDAFTDTLFKGNPGAVVLCDAWLPDAVMQSIAAENNLAETSFIVQKGNDFYIRYFTPKDEINLCGHVTLCSAHVIFTHLGFHGPVLTLHTHLAGDVFIRKDGDLYTLDFPAWEMTTYTGDIGVLAAALNIPRDQILYAGSNRDLIIVIENERDIQNLSPNYALLKQIPQFVCVTAASDDGHFVSRFFTPSDGIDEDPVTGSAHCTLIPYWAQKLNKFEFVARQLSARGGVLYCKFKNDRVDIAGGVVTYLQGKITIPTVV